VSQRYSVYALVQRGSGSVANESGSGHWLRNRSDREGWPQMEQITGRDWPYVSVRDRCRWRPLRWLLPPLTH
jgi:hypothetical protein